VRAIERGEKTIEGSAILGISAGGGNPRKAGVSGDLAIAR
jgi:hypothetical protein